MTWFNRIKLAPAVFLFSASVATADGHEVVSADEVFLPENAILDTSILFAIGAREAQQELRGSYGWDTFQEGLVEGVYFRFDPDGYARFSPNARLDTDLFEVLCRPRTLNCVARKGPLAVAINAQGMLQLSIEGVAAGDQFFISDLVNEIELPDRILQPLDASFENVLAVGGELIIRRGQNETNRISLLGFSAVTSYLRWILAEQDYLALPRNWPVPNGNRNATSSSLTAPDAWRNVAVGASNSQVQASQAALIEASNATNQEIASLRALVEQMSESNAPSNTASQPMNAPLETLSMQSTDPVHYELRKAMARIEALEMDLLELHAEVKGKGPMGDNSHGHEMSQSLTETDIMATQKPELVLLAEQIQMLTMEFGIDPSVAALLLRQQNRNSQANLDHLDLLVGSDMASDSISDLLDTMPANSAEQEQKSEPAGGTGDDRFVLLTDYFRSVSPTQ